MASSTKNVLINIQANTNQIVGGLANLSAKIDTLNKLFASISKSSNSALGGIASSASKSSTAMGLLASSTTKVASAMGPLASSANKVLASMSPAKIDAARLAWEKVGDAFGKMKPPGMEGLKDIFDPGKIATATGYRLAYGIADLPMKAFAAVKDKIKTEIDSASSFEGNLYDLKAYLGGAAGELLEKYAAELGRSGTSDQLQAGALSDIQNKILDVGQTTTFTANEIAQALTEAAKAGVTIQELGRPGQQGALEAIALLAQNTGEDLTKSAIITSKLQEAFRSNLNKSQIQFGKTANEADQYLMVVNALAQADTTSAASASQLTEALFNVGGSANNINMSFFDTLSLVGAMVPAFESAASAGTSLKYVFSRITGANSSKARDQMMAMNLMDESGQSVFFDSKGFKGMKFMVGKLRETFGDQAGMAVDVRNKIITEIFGQDAQKAISRMVSMTEDQAQDMYKAADSMTQNASTLGDPGSVNFAQQTANIKNEGLEYDLEFLRGSLDSISKTLTVPLLKPMSAVTQSLSGFANGMFAVLKGGEKENDSIKQALDMIDTKMLPNSMELFTKALDYARTLKVGLDAITKEGFNTNSIATALAALLGTEKKFMAVRVEEYKVLLTQVYNGIGEFIKKLPGYLDQFKNFANTISDAIIKGFSWIIDNWQEIVTGLKIILSLVVANWAVTAASNWTTLATALISYTKAAGGLANAAKILPAVTQSVGLPAAVVNGTSGLLGNISKGNNWTSVGSAIQTAMLALKTNFITVVGAMSTAWAGFTALFTGAGFIGAISSVGTALTAAIGAILSPIGIAIILIAGLAAAWYFNVGGIQEWMMTEFGSTIAYVQQTFSLIYDAVVGAWTQLSAWFKTKGGTDFLMIFSNILKVLTVMIQGLVLILGGVLKTLVGVLTLNGDLIGSGLFDIFSGVINLLSGVLATFMGFIHKALSGTVKAINQFSRFTGGGNVIDEKAFDDFFKNFLNNQTTGGMESGLYVGKGIAEGLRNGKGDVKNATLELTGTIKNTIAKDLIISSPSQIAIRDGELFGMGLAEGLTNSIPVVQEAALAVTDALKNTVKSNLVNNITKGETQIVLNPGKGTTTPKTVTASVPAYVNLPKSTNNLSYQDKSSRSPYGNEPTLRAAQLITENDAKDYFAKFNGFYMDVAKDMIDKEVARQTSFSQAGLAEGTKFGYSTVNYSLIDNVSEYGSKVDIEAIKKRLDAANPGEGNYQFPSDQNYSLRKDTAGSYVYNAQGNKVFLRLGESVTQLTRNNAQITAQITKIVNTLDKRDKLRVEGSRGAKSDVEGYIKSGAGTGILTMLPPPTTYNFAQVGGAGGFIKEFADAIGSVAQTVVGPVIRKLTAGELSGRVGPGYAPLTQLPV
ncbi:MAG: phage tail tape measure protein, partial [Candidatus Nanopelagicales bacterium]|nr:phage tail tape measure protein [Candidatus Nanopelagicales bacterium]